jgi:Domain of unknown function (DUF4129)
MGPREAVEAHPRRTVEILDDAWRIYFADPQLLLALTALFYVPAATCLVLVVAEPGDAWTWRLLLPALTALVLPLTGLSAGACQEAFYSWAEGYPVGFGECLKAACQRGLHHVASQALSLIGPVALMVCLVSTWFPGALRVVAVVVLGLITIVMSLFGLSRHPSFAAGKPRFWRAVRYGLRASGQDFGRALLLVSVRGLLLLFAIFNLHLFGSFLLWAGENLGGFDVAYLGVLCSLGNSAYLLALALLAWCLLSPFNEAANYLFFMDVRTRFEGLDLWNRVEDLFPAIQRGKAGAILLAVGAGLLAACPVAAQEPLETVRAARQELQAIRKEVQTTQPYAGGQPWVGRLAAVGTRLENSADKPGGYRWFQLALEDFPKRNQAEALDLLDDLDARLALVEESLSRPRQAGNADAPPKDRIKALVPPEKRSAARTKSQVDERKEKPKNRQRVDDDGGPGDGFGKPAGPGLVGPTAIGGAANALLVLLIALGVAVLVAGVSYLVYQWWQERPRVKPRQAGALSPNADDFLDDPDKQDPVLLWRQADERARSGDYLGAVRTIYLAVLALLHQGGFIRYERTRTNGEYVDQLRPRALLQRPFLGLTGVFEVKWYGERACASDDYRQCRELAEEIRVGSLVS